MHRGERMRKIEYVERPEYSLNDRVEAMVAVGGQARVDERPRFLGDDYEYFGDPLELDFSGV